MTKKRFEEYDNGFEDKIKNEYFETNEEIVDRLNALHEENERLKQQRDFYLHYVRLHKLIKKINGDVE